MAATVQGGQKNLPVFVKARDINVENRPLTTLEMCRAAEAITGPGKIEGAQPIRGLWRIYCLSQEARIALLTEKIHLRGLTVDVYDRNPFSRPEGENTYLAVHDIPLSYDNNEITKWLETHGFTPVSPVRDLFARDEQGK